MINQLIQKNKAILPGLGLSIIVAIIGKLCALALPSLGGATLAILLGIVLGNTIFKQAYLADGTKFSESKLLECSVVLLGFTVTFQTISRLGLNGLGFIIVMMTVVIISAMFNSRDQELGPLEIEAKAHFLQARLA